MPSLLLFTAYLGLALVVAALVFYPVFVALGTTWAVGPDRVFYRLAMIVAALGFWPFLRVLGIANGFALGFSINRRRFLRALGIGLAAGVTIMAAHAALLVVFGARAPVAGDVSFTQLSYTLLSGLLSGLVVALVEEIFFRGAMQGHMRRDHPMWTTLALTGLLYASLHFIRPAELAPGTVINWNSGWVMLAGMFGQYRDFTGIVDSFVALFVAGLLLGLIRERTGHVAVCVGLHAGRLSSHSV